MINVAEAATRKIGPLPAFAWGGIVGGGVLAWKMLHGGGGGGGAASDYVQPVGGPGGMDFEGDGGGGEGPATTPPVGSGAIGTVGGNGKTILHLLGTKPAFLWTNPLSAHHDKQALSGSYVVKKVNKGGKWWYQIVSGANGQKTARDGWYIPYYSGASSLYKTSVTTA